MHLPLGRAFEDKVCRWEGLSGSNKSAAVCDLCQIQGKRRQTYINGGEGLTKVAQVCRPKFVRSLSPSSGNHFIRPKAKIS